MKLGPSAVIAAATAATALLACGGKPKPAQLAPLPDDKPPPAAPKPAEPAPEPPAVEEAPPAPKGPIEVKLPAQQTKVKLIAKGAGKLAPLRYTGKAGGKQQVELALNFSTTESMGDQKNEVVIPTIVLRGEAETRSIAKDGAADYAISISGTDARDVPGARLKTDDLKQMLASLTGLVISGTIAANGAAGDVTLRVEKPDQLTEGALEMVRLTLPTLPVLPAEPIGVGAKWQTTTTTTLADKIAVTQTTDYELVAAKGGTWSIKGKTAITGADQDLHGGKISNIHGSGQSELVLAAGALYPSYKSSVETQFTASEKDQSMTLSLRTGGAVTAK
ncbi:MAG TPA: hypothetical protein VN253_02825 [Kofleriaceae bacterium]|nr:hypothetical protein [Kofleriaceae bacterium]